MERYEGILRIQLRNVGSRSEGYYPVLIREPLPSEAAEDAAPQTETLRLAREGAAYGDNSYFEPFDGVRVRIEGVMSHGWFVVERIAEAPAVSGASCPAPDSDGAPRSGESAGEESADWPYDKERL